MNYKYNYNKKTCDIFIYIKIKFSLILQVVVILKKINFTTIIWKNPELKIFLSSSNFLSQYDFVITYFYSKHFEYYYSYPPLTVLKKIFQYFFHDFKIFFDLTLFKVKLVKLINIDTCLVIINNTR